MANIRKRLLNGYLSMMALMLVSFGVALYLVTRWRLTMEVDADLDSRIDQFVSNMNISGDEIELEVRKADIEHDFFWQIGLPGSVPVDHSKAYVDVQAEKPADPDRVGRTTFWTSTTPQGTHMRFGQREVKFTGPPRTLKLVTIHLGDHMEITEKSARYTHEVSTLVLDTGTSLAPRDEALNTLMIILLISVPATLALSALGGVYLVGRALDPVVAITKAAADVGPGNLRARVPVGLERDEISSLAEVINGMLDRIAEGFQRERQFTGDASHELRTPLTVLRGDIEVSLRRTRSQEEYRQVLLRCLDEAGRMERVVEGLLFLARADAGRIKLDPMPIDLAALLTKLTASVRRLPGSPEIRLAKMDGRLLLV
ncbi:MAG TPA: histidine kinase dimerization/phospho-acceptor domain-containing protein, partial [Planctomycetota bacterium]|nr:histidine kinase dimerization/phospho-acceptor domain-containing protein [Planctomycetota bacterium]